MSVLFLKDFFGKLRTNDPRAYKQLRDRIRVFAPLDSDIMSGYSRLSSDQITKLHSAFLDYGVPAGVIFTREDIEEAYKIFYADYVHSAPN